MNTREKIECLRKLMKKHSLDAYFIDDSDKHSSEYVNDYYKERSFMSSFCGSNGFMLVTLDKAFLWTDGRYFLQAEKDLKDTGISLMKLYTPGYPNIVEYIRDNLKDKRIGLCGEYVSYSLVEEFKKYMSIDSECNLVSEIWIDKEELKTEPIKELPISLVGEDRLMKISRVREKLAESDASIFISNIDDIAWLYNLRGSDVPITPVFLSFTYIDEKNAYLFLNRNVLNKDAYESLTKDGITVCEYDDVLKFLMNLNGRKVLVSLDTTNYSFVKAIEKNNKVINKISPTVMMKAIKNDTEIKNLIDIHKADGLAVFRYMKYIKENYGKIPMDEYGLAEKVLEFRKMDERFYEVSFESISSWNENGAIIHYEPTKESSKKVTGSGFLLLDSGGQYLGGTTDITRTYSLGEITEEMKHHYTLVLRSHIDVSMCKFLKGANGINIDMLAREPFWAEGLDYKHGTGHGVGYMLNVHESPNSFRYQRSAYNPDAGTIVPGMVTTIEPGIYLEGKYGIRTENELLCVNGEKKDTDEFYEFKTVTFAPYDLDPLIVSELTQYEKTWLNSYHKMVYDVLSKICDKSELEYLKYVTREV
ncbi:aminopeptidase P family protein [bacterium]|nr:aminopeptidase P family protein [bacterium]